MKNKPTTDNRQPTKKFLFLVVSCLLFVSAPLGASAQEVDILWQGETYTSPFYKGRALWSMQSKINFLAIPHGLGSPANLIYKWTKNDTVLGNINGVGKNTLSFLDSVLSRPQVIKVDILAPDKTVLASASTGVIPIPPRLAIYENNPLYGFMFHRETGDEYRLQEREVTFAAFPFFFSASDRANFALSYEWRTNAGGLDAGDSATYRSPDNTAGFSEISVRASNEGKIMQTAQRSFLVQFGQ